MEKSKAEEVVRLMSEIKSLDKLDNVSADNLGIDMLKNRTKSIYISFGSAHNPDAFIAVPSRHKSVIIDALDEIKKNVEQELADLAC